MNTAKTWRFLLLVPLLAAGTLFLMRPTGLTPESTAGRTARLGAFAPAGATGHGETAAPETLLAVAPVTVWPEDVAMTSSGPSQYERWLAGEIDLDEQHSLLTEAERAAARDASIALLPDEDIHAIAAAPALSVGFDGLDFNDHPSATFVPPDPDLTVGATHVIAVVNSIFEIYLKNGTSLIGPLAFSNFFAALGQPACTTSGIGPFDPIVLYDESADRYIIAVDGNGTHLCVAVSTSGDATGAYYQYAFPTNVGGRFFDYPQGGVGRDAIYVGANLFGGTFESRVWAFDKAAMYAGVAANAVSQSLGSVYSTPQPAKLHGFAQGTWPGSGPHYIVARLNDHSISLFRWADPFGVNNFTNAATFDLTAATGVTPGFPVDVPQLGSPNQIEANDSRLLDLEFRNGRLWTAMTIACNPGGGTVNCIRWAEINPTGPVPALVQAGVAATPGNYRIFPDLAVDNDGNMAVGYTKSNSAMYPAVWTACRAAADPPGTLASEVELKAGETFYAAYDVPPFRWGDYTGMTIDPDGERFWYIGEYAKNYASPASWGTYISSFTAEECLPTPLSDRAFTPAIVRP